jgi:hypothetical protein
MDDINLNFSSSSFTSLGGFLFFQALYKKHDNRANGRDGEKEQRKKRAQK